MFGDYLSSILYSNSVWFSIKKKNKTDFQINSNLHEKHETISK